MGNDNHEEVIEVESIKDLSEAEQVERIADKFSEVSNLYEPLRRDKIVFPVFSCEAQLNTCTYVLSVCPSVRLSVCGQN